jgi:hypothetical protein
MEKNLKLTFSLFILMAFSAKSFSQWLPDTRLTIDPAFTATPFNDSRCIAASGSFLHMICFDTRDGNREIYYKRSSDEGTSWGNDVRLTNSAATSHFPSIAVSGSFVHAAWEEYRDGNAEIYYKHSFDNGITWSEDLRLTNNSSNSLSPSITVSGSIVHLTWFDSRDGNREIYYKRSTDNGNSWTADTRLTNNSSSSIYPAIASIGSIAYILWEEYRDGNGEIYFKQSTDDGTSWQPDTRLTFNSANSLSLQFHCQVLILILHGLMTETEILRFILNIRQIAELTGVQTRV